MPIEHHRINGTPNKNITSEIPDKIYRKIERYFFLIPFSVLLTSSFEHRPKFRARERCACCEGLGKEKSPFVKGATNFTMDECHQFFATGHSPFFPLRPMCQNHRRKNILYDNSEDVFL